MEPLLNRRLLISLAVVVAVIAAGGFLVVVQQGATTSAQYQPPASLVTGATYVNTNVKLQLRLSVNASFTGGTDGNVTIQMKVDEYNTFPGLVDDVPAASLWALDGLSLGSCGNGVYPFGASALHREVRGRQRHGRLAAADIPDRPVPTGSQEHLGIPLPTRQRPGAGAPKQLERHHPDAGQRDGDGRLRKRLDALGPGTYTVAAGDEWGSLATVYFTIGTGTTSSTTSSTPTFGSLGAQLAILSASSAALPISALTAPFARVEPGFVSVPCNIAVMPLTGRRNIFDCQA